MLLSKRQRETTTSQIRRAETKVHKFSFQTNFELNPADQNEVKYVVDSDQNKLLMHLDNEIRIICLSDMKIYRIIDDIPERIDSAGFYSDGVYIITSNDTDSHLSFFDTESVSDPLT